VVGSGSPNFVHFEDAKRLITASLAARTARGQGSDTLRHIHSGLFGGRFGDTLIGDDSDNDLQGGAGDDTLVGRGGSDMLPGQGGDDVLRGGKGNDLADY
jgi:Ca2+-binding RTX toxin-like protein